MSQLHLVSVLYCFYLIFAILSSFVDMGLMRIGSLNINGARDQTRRAVLAEYMKIRNIDIVMLQETHSDKSNEIEWGLWWEGKYALSHGSNLSAGVAILFSNKLTVDIKGVEEVENGRILCVNVEIEGIKFLFINVYAPNIGVERVELFLKFKRYLLQCDKDLCIVMAGDWNCTENFKLDRTREEPHFQSGLVLSDLVKECELDDVWRNRNNQIKQYTWIKMGDNEVKGARLDRIYLSKCFNNRVIEAAITPSGFSDHHMVTIDVNKKITSRAHYYWHFNKKLLYDTLFL